MNYIEQMVAELCPQGVEFRELGEIAAYSNTRISAASVDANTFVGVDNLLPNQAGRTASTHVPTTGNLTEYQPGDVLIGNIRPYLKKIWLATNRGGCSGDVLAVRISDAYRCRVQPGFLYQLLSSEAFFDFDMKHAKGGKMPRGSKAMVLQYRIPVPPLPIQQEIVRVLDKFSQLVRELQANLQAELVARRKQYQYYRDQLLSFEGRKDVRWGTLGEVAAFKYGFTAKAASSGAFRFIRITDITEGGKLSPVDPKYVDATGNSVDYLVQKGDVLMARTGATFGKTVLIVDDTPAVYASFLIRIKLDETAVLPSYYWHFAQSSFYWHQANSMVSTGGQQQFNANVLKDIRLPIPSLEVQEEIVTILDKFDALVNDLSIGLPAEIAARQKQYEYYRDRLLTFPEAG